MARIRAREYRSRMERDIDIGDGETVLVRKRDMVTLFMEGRLPLTMLSEMRKVLEVAKEVIDDPERLVEFLTDGHEDILDMLREFVCACVVDPVCVMTPDDNPDHLDVHVFDANQLMLIWRGAFELMGINTQTEAASIAARFRAALNKIPNGTALPAGQNVRPKAKQLVRRTARRKPQRRAS